MRFGVLGPVTAWDDDGRPLDLKGPRHRSVLARLIVARGRVVPLGVLIDDLWPPSSAHAVPANAAGAIRTFVGALRRALEPDRPPRSPSRVLLTQGPGYALAAGPGDVDAGRFEQLATAAASAPPGRALDLATEGLALWRGPAYAGFAAEPWAAAESARLTETRLSLAERHAEAQLGLGLAVQAVPALRAHTAGHPWREEGWRLLALALYRTGRQADALAVVRQARSRLAGELGLDPGPRLAALETGLLRHDPALDGPGGDVWADTAAAYQQAAPALTRTRLESAATLAGSLALAGGPRLTDAMSQRLAAIEAAEPLGDPALTARVIGNFDVPGIWPVSDDPVLAARIVAAAERTLAALPAGSGDALRARVLATIALESRGSRDPRPHEAAAGAVVLARRLGDPRLLAFALAGRFMQTCDRPGLAGARDAIGAELLGLAGPHGLVNYEVMGHLICLQARSARGDFTAADAHAAALDDLGERHERPLVAVFTTWYRALRAAAHGAEDAEIRYRDAAKLLANAGMPGVEHGLLPLAVLALRVWHHQPTDLQSMNWGPYRPWAQPWLDLARDDRTGAAAALRRCPEPPPGLLTEALWCLTARAAVVLGDADTARAACAALGPAAGEIAGAASGLLTAGPVQDYLTEAEPLTARGPR